MNLSLAELQERAEIAWSWLESCEICPRLCRVNRLAGEQGRCRAGAELLVSSVFPHFGEESCLVGAGGSGTVFLSSCNLRCSFCQNYDISQAGEGRGISFDGLASALLELQRVGCHNVNFVTPTHFTPQLLRVLTQAVRKGLQLPIVWNTSGYERVETLRLLEGIVDIYMPDFKFWKSATARELARAPDYPQTAKAALKEMHRQVGDLVVDGSGIARRGLLVRHLVMPEGVEESAEIMRYLATEISPHTFVNVMAQYRPCGRIKPGERWARRITAGEYREALRHAKEAGLTRLAD